MPPIPRRLDDTRRWTYGAEHELGDWDTRLGWKGYGRDPEPNVMNLNGIAADPALKDYPFGAEINTPPTDTPDGQGDSFEAFISRHPNVYVGHRAGTHIHIRVPGLIDSLQSLKRLQRYTLRLADSIREIDPIPYPSLDSIPEGSVKESRKWAQLIRKSHWTLIPAGRVEKQCLATTVDAFFRAEAPEDRHGNPLYHAQPRASINLRQLKQTDTIEFRHFFQALTPDQVVTATEWCRDILSAAFDNADPAGVVPRYVGRAFPPVPTFSPWRERRWAATSLSKVKRPEAAIARAAILSGQFDDVRTDGEEFSHLVV